MECPTATRPEHAFSSRFPPRTEDRSVLVVILWCDLTMNCALSTRPSLNAVMSPCTGCYKPILLTLYGGLTAAMRQCHLNNIHFYYYYYYYYPLTSFISGLSMERVLLTSWQTSSVFLIHDTTAKRRGITDTLQVTYLPRHAVQCSAVHFYMLQCFAMSMAVVRLSVRLMDCDHTILQQVEISTWQDRLLSWLPACGRWPRL